MKHLLSITLLFTLFISATTPGAAADPARYRTDTIEPRVRQVPAEIQRGVFSDPEESVEPLVRFLVAGQTDDFQKAKLIHDWIADNIEYDVESYFSGSRADSSSTGTLQGRRAVCHGYATLMEEMCALAGIPCQNISGYGRGYRFGTERDVSVDQVNHAWSAVRIEGRWYLVDTTWDAGHVEQRSFEKRYRTTYLFMEPENFVYTHLPSESKWQLLASPLTAEQFERLPHLRGAFFDFGLRLTTKLSRLTKVSKSVQFSVGLAREVELMADLFTPAGDKLPRRAWVQRDGQRCLIYVIFPRKGRHRLKLYSRPLGAETSFKSVAELDFDATWGTTRAFPKDYASFGRLRGFLYSPLYTPLATDKPLLFKVRLLGAHDVSLAIGDRPWLSFVPSSNEKNVYELTTSVPAGVRVRLNAKLSPEADSYKNLIEFAELRP